jgi:hypothetical protein
MRHAKCWVPSKSLKKSLTLYLVGFSLVAFMSSSMHFTNTVFLVVFIIRYAERRIDQLLDAAILSYTPMPSEFEAVQFESEWSFLRPFSGKKKLPPSPNGHRVVPATPPSPAPHRPISPTGSQATISSSTSRGFSSLRQTVNRARGQASGTSISAIFQDHNLNHHR